MAWKLTTATLVLAFGIANSAVAVSVAQINQWFGSAQNAVARSDYDTAIINYKRIINNSNSGCEIMYYARWLQAAQEAKAIIKVGGSPDNAFELFTLHVRKINSDPQLGCD